MWSCQIAYSNKQVFSKDKTHVAEKQLKCSKLKSTGSWILEILGGFIFSQSEWSKLSVVEVGVQTSTVTVEIIIVVSQKADNIS